MKANTKGQNNKEKNQKFRNKMFMMKNNKYYMFTENLRNIKTRRNNPRVINPEILDEIISSTSNNKNSTEPLVASPPQSFEPK